MAVSVSFIDIFGGGLDLTDTYTHNGVSVGTAASDRKVVVAIMAEKANDGTNPRVASVTINGNSMTKLVERQGDLASNGGSWAMFSALFVYDLASGTTADIVASFNSDMEFCGVGVYAVYGAHADTVVEDDGGGAVSPLTLSLNTETDGAVIAASATAYYDSPASHTWAGVTQDDSFTNYDGVHQSCASSLVSSGATPRTVTCSQSYIGDWSSAAVAVAFKPAATVITGTASFTEPNETLSSAADHPVTGSASFTEANETVSSAASHPVIGTAEFTEPVETLSSAVTVQWFANASFTEPNETLDGAATHPVIGNALNSDEPNETLSSDVAVQNLGVVDVTEAVETLSSDVTVEGGVDCVAAFTEPNETLTGAATVLATGSLTQTEPNETLSSAVTHPVLGTAEFTEANETLSSAGTVETLGVVNVTEAVETLSSDVSHPVLGTALQNTEANESLTGEATASISATLNATEPNETLSSLTGVAIVADAAFTEPNERLNSLVETGTGFVYGTYRRVNIGIGIRI